MSETTMLRNLAMSSAGTERQRRVSRLGIEQERCGSARTRRTESNRMRISQTKIAVVSGFWGQNIGNAFFNVGGKWLMEQAVPDADCIWFQDQPGYRTFHDQATGNPPNHADLIAALDVDYVVLQGPMLTDRFRALWESTFRRLRERGTGIVLLSAGLFKYTDAEIRAARSFLEDYPPQMLTTRDSETFRHFKDVCELSYDGIESALCAPDAFRVPRLHIPPSVAVCFDRYPEPDFIVDANAATTRPTR
jgi:hypothetical protein